METVTNTVEDVATVENIEIDVDNTPRSAVVTQLVPQFEVCNPCIHGVLQSAWTIIVLVNFSLPDKIFM